MFALCMFDAILGRHCAALQSQHEKKYNHNKPYRPAG